MHKKFNELGVKIPDKTLHKVGGPVPEPGFGYPLLVKEIYSCGALGFHKIASYDHLVEKIEDHEIQSRNPYLIIQRLLNIDRDLRVVLIGEEIVLFHWRINPDPDPKNGGQQVIRWGHWPNSLNSPRIGATVSCNYSNRLN